jgi:hypothetical protein
MEANLWLGADMTRRKAILAVLCGMAGKRMLSQVTITSQSKPFYRLDLREIDRFEFIMNDKTITISGDEIWKELLQTLISGEHFAPNGTTDILAPAPQP